MKYVPTAICEQILYPVTHPHIQTSSNPITKRDIIKSLWIYHVPDQQNKAAAAYEIIPNLLTGIPQADCEDIRQQGFTVWHLAGRRSTLWLGVSAPALADGRQRDEGEPVTRTSVNSWNNPQHTGGAAIPSHAGIYACTQATHCSSMCVCECVCYVTKVEGLYRWISRTPTIS